MYVLDCLDMAQAAHRWQCEQIRAIEGTADGGKSNELRAKVTDGLALSVRLGVTSSMREAETGTGSSGFDEVDAASTSGTLPFNRGAKRESRQMESKEVMMYDE